MRQILGTLFDPTMCKERNGIRCLWQSETVDSLKCPHVTIGPADSDRLLAESLIGKKLNFGRLDYKRVGPIEPHLQIDLLKFKKVNSKESEKLEALTTSLSFSPPTSF